MTLSASTTCASSGCRATRKYRQASLPGCRLTDDPDPIIGVPVELSAAPPRTALGEAHHLTEAHRASCESETHPCRPNPTHCSSESSQHALATPRRLRPRSPSTSPDLRAA